MNKHPHFVALLGSLRRNSLSRAVANTLDEIAPDHVQVTTLETIGDLPYYNEDVQQIAIPDEVRDLAAAVSEADAVVIVTPEYNYSFPGVLKNALDWLSRLPAMPFSGKPVAIQTVSAGRFGGIRAQFQLRQVLVSLDAIVLNKPEVMIANAADLVDSETGSLRDEQTRRHVAAQLEALLQLSFGSVDPVALRSV